MMPAISSDDDDQSSDSAPRSDRAGDILVVDDEAAVCRTVEHLLARNGYTVTVCMDGLSAVDMIAQHNFAVALVDLNLSDVYGSQVIRRPARPGQRFQLS
jgi:CheY-like chemotaxis protein